MDQALLQTLPVAQRLALNYAPGRTREATLALLALDTRLASILRADGEPVIAQMKLAWWRERFAQHPSQWPVGEPLLALIGKLQMDCGSLGKLVDGWELLLAAELGDRELAGFAEGRAAGWRAVAAAAESPSARELAAEPAKGWALADLALHLDAETEANLARETAFRYSEQAKRLPRDLRTLAVLHALSFRALKRGSGDVLDGPGALLTAMRVGFVGR